MRVVWQALRSDLVRSIDTLRARRQFELVKLDRPELRRFGDVASLLDYLHTGPGDLDDKDRILAALVQAVHAGGDNTEVPEAVLWLALWPGLDALYHRLWRHFPDAHEDLVSEIAVHFPHAIHRADLTRVRPVATLLRNVERDVRSILRRAREERARLVELPDHDDQHEGRHGGDPGYAGGPGPSAFGISPGSDADQETCLLRDRLCQEIGAHADLVVAVVIVGERPREIAEPEAARKRCQRALDCLRQRLFPAMNAALSRSTSAGCVFSLRMTINHTPQGNEAMLVTAPETDADDLLRLPGLFRRWELEQIVEAGNDYRIEDAGIASDGTPLFAVYA